MLERPRVIARSRAVHPNRRGSSPSCSRGDSMSSWLRLACTALLAGAAFAAHPQSGYPNQPIKVIVPFPPAGGTDVVSRLLVDKLHEATGWTFGLDNTA